MKKLSIAVVIVVGLLFVSWMIQKPNTEDELLVVEPYSQEITNEIADLEGSLESHPRLELYINQLRETQSSIDEIKNDIQLIKTDLNETKAMFQENGIELSEVDRAALTESMKVIRLNQYMLQETLGDVYQQLVYVRENKDNLSELKIKSILIDVYQTIQARQQMFENIYDELIQIQTVISVY